MIFLKHPLASVLMRLACVLKLQGYEQGIQDCDINIMSLGARCKLRSRGFPNLHDVGSLDTIFPVKPAHPSNPM